VNYQKLNVRPLTLIYAFLRMNSLKSKSEKERDRRQSGHIVQLVHSY
jgi:hypothetical protein